MSKQEVNSLSSQAEKILDEYTSRTQPGNVDPRAHAYAPIEAAAVLAELAKAHAMIELADAIRESVSIHINRP